VSDVRVTNNEGEKRYEVRVDGELAGAAYYDAADDLIVFTHTEVDDAYEGQGIGSSLARGALDDVRERGMSIRVKCPFIKKFVDSHDEYADLEAR
jgi:predicted GNAT family acetyltransferase